MDGVPVADKVRLRLPVPAHLPLYLLRLQKVISVEELEQLPGSQLDPPVAGHIAAPVGADLPDDPARRTS